MTVSVGLSRPRRKTGPRVGPLARLMARLARFPFMARLALIALGGLRRPDRKAARADLETWPDYMLRDVGLPARRGEERRSPMDWGWR